MPRAYPYFKILDFKTLALGAIVSSFSVPSAALGQTVERPIDRLLIVETDGSAAGLEMDGRRLFPDRDRRVGPGYWELVRDDGSSSLDIESALGSARAGLAHVYVKSPRDATIAIRATVPECVDHALAFNGQKAGSNGVTPVRLAAGWNTLLIALSTTDQICDLALDAAITSATALVRQDDEALDLGELTVQASRPPGARPNYPDGFVLPFAPEPVGMSWAADGNLMAEIDIGLASWGRPQGAAAPGGPERPTGPPTVDLTGTWEVTLYAPTGILESTATLTMSEAGLLEGRLEGERIDGEIRDGWVSGDQFGWSIQAGGRRGGFEIRMQGRLTDDVMTGTMDFGGFRDFDARFEGARAGGDGGASEGEEAGGADSEAPDEAGAAQEAEDRQPEDRQSQDREPDDRGPGGFPAGNGADVPQIPAPGDVDPVAERDELAPPDDPDGLRARIVAQLLRSDEDPPQPAPADASVEFEVGGGAIDGAVADLVPVNHAAVSGTVRFSQARSAALDDEGVRGRVRWHDDDHDFVGRLSAEALLRAFHGPIRLTGWGLEGAEGFAGEFRIPDELAGFTLRVGEGSWTVGGAAATSALCAPCQRGQRLDVRVTGSDEPTVFVEDAGYPDSSGADADRWLEALRGDNEQYRRMASSNDS